MSDERIVPNQCVYDSTTGVAFIAGAVNDEMHRHFHEMFLKMDAKNPDRSIPAVIYFTTEGGGVNTALGIYDLVKAQRRETVLVANGECSSAGVIILQGAQVRKATRSSQLLVHFGSEAIEAAAEAKHFRQVGKYLTSIFVERTSKSARTVNKWHEGETYFSAEEAKEAGLIDEVLA